MDTMPLKKVLTDLYGLLHLDYISQWFVSGTLGIYDLIAVALILFWGLRCMRDGLILNLLYVMTWVVAYFVARQVLLTGLGVGIRFQSEATSTPLMRRAFFFVIFAVSWFCLRVFVFLTRRLWGLGFFSIANRFLGFVYGMVEMFALIGVFFWAAETFFPSSAFVKKAQSSLSGVVIQQMIGENIELIVKDAQSMYHDVTDKQRSFRKTPFFAQGQGGDEEGPDGAGSEAAMEP